MKLLRPKTRRQTSEFFWLKEPSMWHSGQQISCRSFFAEKIHRQTSKASDFSWASENTRGKAWGGMALIQP